MFRRGTSDGRKFAFKLWAYGTHRYEADYRNKKVCKFRQVSWIVQGAQAAGREVTKTVLPPH